MSKEDKKQSKKIGTKRTNPSDIQEKTIKNRKND